MLTASLLLVARRTASHIKLLSAVVIGVVLAVTVMSSSVIYFDALRNLALDRSLNSVDQSSLDIQLQASATPVNDVMHRRIVDAMEGSIVRRMAPYTDGSYYSVRSWTFLIDEPAQQVRPGDCPCRLANAPNQPGDDFEAGTIACDCRRMNFITLPALQENTRIIDGRFPEPLTSLPGEGSPLIVEVALDATSAEQFGLTVGGELKGRTFWADQHQKLVARVVGVYERTDPEQPMWRIFDDAFSNRTGTLEFAQFLVPDETILYGFNTYFPGMGADYAWLLDIEPSKISASDTTQLRRTLEVTNNELRAIVDGYSLKTTLASTLRAFETDLFFNRLPMFIVLILIVLVVLYYVVTLASLLVDAQRSEVALLRSRGATSRQILAVFVIESTALSVFAVVVGPLLALLGVGFIGTLPFYSDLNGGDPLPVTLSATAYRLAAIGGVLTMLALFIPAIRAARLGLLTDRRARARPPRLAFVQRYYLDLGLLAVVLFLFWQLTKQGSFVATDVFGEQNVDNLVLAVPALFLVAAGVVLLRIFPVTMDLLGRGLSSRYISGFTPPSIVLGIWQMARNPASHARLSLLLILTAGLGVFAASFATTLERSATEQVLYRTGADLRVTSLNIPNAGASYRLADAFSGLDGVIAASAVYREKATITSGFTNQSFDLLGVDADTFPQVAWFRQDIGSGSLETTLRSVETGGAGGLLLPEEGYWLTALVRPLSSQPDTLLVARMSDANGRYYTLLIGRMLPESFATGRFSCSEPQPGSSPEWCRIGARITPLPLGRPSALAVEWPVRLHSIGIAGFSDGIGSGAFDIDDIAVMDRSENALLVVEEFDELERWRTMQPSTDALGDTFTVATDDDGNELPGVARFRWTAANAREPRGVVLGREEPVIPVVASPTFFENFQAEVGDRIPLAVGSARINVELRGSLDLFPTLNQDEFPFLIADFDAIHEALNLTQLTSEEQPAEVWIRTETGDEVARNRDGFLLVSNGPDPVAALVGQRADELNLNTGTIFDRSAELAAVAVDPLVSAGWQALLGIAFFTVLVVSAIGFLVHSRVAFNNRRGELALLRTMGLSMPQLLTLVVLEQVIVIGVAIAIGIFMGTRLGDTIMPFLANSGEDIVLVPPMVLQIDWAGFGLTFGLLTIVFVAVVLAVLASVYRMSIHRVMRMGEG